MILTEAMFAAIDEADPEAALSGYSCDLRSNSVELCNDRDGAIAKRLPKWITVEEVGPQPMKA